MREMFDPKIDDILDDPAEAIQQFFLEDFLLVKEMKELKNTKNF